MVVVVVVMVVVVAVVAVVVGEGVCGGLMRRWWRTLGHILTLHEKNSGTLH